MLMDSSPIGQGRSLLERSDLFEMTCTGCDVEQPLLLSHPTGGVQSNWRLWCSICHVELKGECALRGFHLARRWLGEAMAG
jgi:hypothetical protein